MGIEDVEVTSNPSPSEAAAVAEKARIATEAKETEEKSESADADENAEASETSEDTGKGDETEDQDSEETEENHSEEEPEPKKKSGFQKRVDRMRRQLQEKEAELSFLRRQVSEAKNPEKTESRTEGGKADDQGKPKPEDFESFAEYIEKLNDWKYDQRKKADDEKAAAERAQKDLESKALSFQQKAREFSKSKKDFSEVLTEVDDIPMSPILQRLFVESENGPELMYELAKNREEYERINGLPPERIARELGKFEARLEKDQVQKPTKPIKPKAPPPIAPVGSSASSQKHPSKMTTDEYLEWKESQRRKR